MKFCLPLILMFIWISPSTGQTTVSGGNVYGDWNLAGSPYLVEGNILIPDDSVLTIDPGVTVEFQGHYKLFVNGRIHAQGNATDTVVFTIAPDSINSGWWGIRFDSTPADNDTSIIQYCKIEHGNAFGMEDDARGGGICINNYSKVQVANCLITNNKAFREGGGIYCGNGSSPIIEYNTISYNIVEQSDGGGISMFNQCNPIIRENTIEHNFAESGGGGIDSDYPCSAFIIDNVIRYNETAGSGAGISSGNSGSHIIIGNTITDNLAQGRGGGIDCYQDDESVIEENVIAFNSSLYSGNHRGGGGIYSNGGIQSIVNNHIVNNTSSAGGGGLFIRGDVSIVGNVVANNTALLGGGIYLERSGVAPASPNLINCTISNNLSTGSGVNDGGGGLYCDEDRDPEIRNVIFHGNEAANGNGHDVYLLDNASDPEITYSNVPGGLNAIYTNGNPYTGTYGNNYDDNPMFSAPSTGTGSSFNGLVSSWTLLGNSLFIDAGSPNTIGLPSNDIVGNQRIIGPMVDLGAYENPSKPAGDEERLSIDGPLVWPNPSSQDIFIEPRDQLTIASIQLYNAFGALVRDYEVNSNSMLRYDLPDMNGIYLLQITLSSGEVSHQKVVKGRNKY